MISLPMALFDYIPVILYCVSAIILQRGLYYSMSKGAFALFSAGTGIFVTLSILGILGMCVGLSVETKKRKKTSAMIMFIITFVFMLMMGYLSSRDFEQASMNWIAEGVNVVGWSIFLIGSRILTKQK